MRDTLKAGRWAQCCFTAQQTAEKAVKALALFRGFDKVKSYSITEICRELGINGEIERRAKRLDLYYISARYPDAFPSGAPFEYFTEDQASDAAAFAEYIVAAAESAIEDLLDLGPRLDILVYTPEEFARLTADPSPGFWRNAVKAMRRVI